VRYEPTFFVGAEGGTHVGFHPARALGPILVAGDFTSAWLYILGPIIGGVLAVLLYDRFMVQTEAPG
jgi:glycerol uptake facilitator-like aquaporin